MVFGTSARKWTPGVLVHVSLALLASVCSAGLQAAASKDARDGVRLADENDGTNWLAYGRTYTETHGSPLKQIDTTNVSRLGLVWSAELPDVNNGATQPLAVDGVVYFTAGPSLVHAFDV